MENLQRGWLFSRENLEGPMQCINYHSASLVIFSSFSVAKKGYLMLSLAMSVRPSIRSSSVEITLERGSNRSAEQIDLKIGLDMGN